MILTCPNCGTQYVVKDGAIPPQGRQVRCASCKHSWHQNPDLEGAPDEQPAIADEGYPPPAEAAPEEEAERVAEPESLAEATLIEPRSGPEAEERAFEEAVIEEQAPAETPQQPLSATETTVESTAVEEEFTEAPAATTDWEAPPEPEAQDDRFSPFPARDEVEPKRRSGLLTTLIVVLVVAAIAAAFWFLAPPEWKARVGLAGAGSSPLALVTTHMDRQRLESGNELLTVTGRVINPTNANQDVPPLQAQLKTRTGQVVYSWTIAPPARSLPPGASARFNSAEINVPPGGDELTITLGNPKA